MTLLVRHRINPVLFHATPYSTTSTSMVLPWYAACSAFTVSNCSNSVSNFSDSQEVSGGLHARLPCPASLESPRCSSTQTTPHMHTCTRRLQLSAPSAHQRGASTSAAPALQPRACCASTLERCSPCHARMTVVTHHSLYSQLCNIAHATATDNRAHQRRCLGLSLHSCHMYRDVGHPLTGSTASRLRSWQPAHASAQHDTVVGYTCREEFWRSAGPWSVLP